MTLDIDTRTAPRSHLDLRNLVHAIANAGKHDETDYIEWKSTLDLETKRTKATIARHVIAMANRKPDIARKSFEGFGYIVIGADPSGIHGVTSIDLADLESGVRSYIGDNGPTWIPTYVPQGDKSVLVVTVDPPKNGDMIHTLHKDFEKYSAGDIYIRRMAQTVKAGPAEIQQLSERYASRTHGADFHFTINGDYIRCPLFGDHELRIENIAREKQEELLAPERMHRSEGRLPRSIPISMDNRSENDYRSEVEEYLEELKAVSRGYMLRSYVLKNYGIMRGLLVNDSEHNYDNVRVDIDIPEGFLVIEREDYEEYSEDYPNPPEPIGTRYSPMIRPLSNFSQNLQSSTPDVLIESRKLMFNIRHLRPRETYSLPVVHWIAEQEFEEVVTSWSATATNTPGLVAGDITVSRDGTIVKSESS
ncbi:hypothetical protein F4561_006499 [Lipingzhangella halophila]|uniref:Schlafen AlbA-2 domain-containing protein n=1 Tax=Lipingzhangella halophila TaxID=1783352 RepID=A0A7W7RP63_9ACTN|nr:ATP-binding protein [Lipingzhangella halophila]MBB4935605.1 hypothetical protein [Lipingzhangella halophila]